MIDYEYWFCLTSLCVLCLYTHNLRFVSYPGQHLQGCMPRFEHLFGPTPKPASPSNQGDQGVKTRVIFCQTLSHLRKQKRVHFEDKSESLTELFFMMGYLWEPFIMFILTSSMYICRTQYYMYIIQYSAWER